MSVATTVLHLSKRIDAYDFATKPLVCGISGPQGSGKSYLAEYVYSELCAKYPKLTILQFLMDDLYLSHSKQLEVTKANSVPLHENRMLQGRGLPGTHDITLAVNIFEHLFTNYKKPFPELKVPRYNKAAFNGEGDQFPEDQWTVIRKPVDIIIFEGWFNGFCSLDEHQLLLKYLTANYSSSLLPKHPFHNFSDLNLKLKEYEKIWSFFDYFVLLATDSIKNVYNWRLQQEHALIKNGGTGMSDSAVLKFVDRYMPMYELYYDKVCAIGCLEPGNNLRIEIDSERNLIQCNEY